MTDTELRKAQGEAGASCNHCQALVDSALAQSIARAATGLTESLTRALRITAGAGAPRP